MPLELPENNIQEMPDKPLSQAVEFPFPPSCDFKSLIQKKVDAALTSEIERNPEFAEKYDEWGSDQTTRPLSAAEQGRLTIESDIELIILSCGDNVKVKEKIFGYIQNLDINSRIHAKRYIKSRISSFVKGLKHEIVDGKFVPNEENYMGLISKFNVNVMLKYPLTVELCRHFVEQLFRMYIELKSLADLPKNVLLMLHSQIEIFVSGLTLNIELPSNFKKILQDFTNENLSKNKVARPLSKQGENSLVSFTVIPAPNEFPDIKPFKDEALDILEDMRDVVYNSMKRATSFEFYFDITSELSFNEEQEATFWAMCSTERRKIDGLYDKMDDLQAKLHELMMEINERDLTVDRMVLSRYMESVEKHIENVWEKAVFPQLLFFAYLLFGKTPNHKSKWF